MKLIHPPVRLLAFLSLLPNLAHAHPGHSALDWFSKVPHAGHDAEYTVWLSALGILTLAYGIFRLGTRQR